MAKTSNEIEKNIRQYIDYAKKEIRVTKVVLYGSYAKGNATDESDIDIAVQSPDFSANYLAECERLSSYVWRSGADLSIEPRPLHPVLEDFLVDEIMKTGRVIYEDPRYDLPEAAY